MERESRGKRSAGQIQARGTGWVVLLLCAACGSSGHKTSDQEPPAANPAPSGPVDPPPAVAEPTEGDASSEPQTGDQAAPVDPGPGCPANLQPVVVERIEGDTTDAEGEPREIWVSHELRIGDERQQAAISKIAATAHDPERVARFQAQDVRALEISAKTAVGLGASQGRTPLWVFPKPDRAPCKMMPGRYLISAGDLDYLVVRELTGDCKLDNNRLLYGLRTDAIGSCRLSASKRIADSKSGEIDKLAGFELKAKKQKSGLDPAACAAPACQLLFAFRGVSHPSGFGAFELEVTWVRPPMGSPDREECDAEVEDFYSLYLRPRANAPLVPFDAVGEISLFEDASGPRNLVVGEDGELRTFDIHPDGTLGPPRTLVWVVTHPEVFTDHSLGPSCGL